MTTDLRSHMAALGDGAIVTYIGQEGGEWHCDIKLPENRYTVSLVTASATEPDEAVAAATERALTMFARVEREEAA